MLIKRDPWFEPLYRRVIITAICAGWLVFELVVDDPWGIWAMIAVFVTGLAVWSFFLSGDYRNKPASDEDSEKPAE